MARRHAKRVAGPALAIALLLPPAAGSAPPRIPDAITPGGASPQSLKQLPVPRPAPDVVPVPPAVQRPLGVEEGTRTFVRRFLVGGVIDRPEQGIRKEEVLALVERLRREYQGLNGAGEGKPTGPARGLTIGQLQEIANAITQYYRRAGFILARAFVPAQEVKKGIVRIEVQEGTLAQVMPQGNKRFSEELMARPFAGLVGEPVTGTHIESALLLLSDYPGLSAYGVFRPGPLPGTTELVLNVDRERLYEGSLNFDNYGTRFTGDNRVVLNLSLNNPLGAADRLTTSLIQSFSPRKSLYGSVRYEVPIYDGRHSLGVGYSRNAYDVGSEFADLGLEGESWVGNVSLTRNFLRGRNRNLFGTLEFQHKKAETSARGTTVTDDELSVIGLELSVDGIIPRWSTIQAMTLRYDHGLEGVLGAMDADQDRRPPSSRIDSNGEFVGGDFDKLTLAYARVQNLTKHQSLLFRLNGQYSPDPLVSVEQFVIGGPTSVRAYPRSEYLMDYGVFGSLEWSIDAPGITGQPFAVGRTWGDVLRLSLFVDYAAGELNDALLNETDSVDIAGAGVGIHLNLPGRISAKLEAARTLGTDKPSDGDRTRYWVDLRYSF